MGHGLFTTQISTRGARLLAPLILATLGLVGLAAAAFAQGGEGEGVPDGYEPIRQQLNGERADAFSSSSGGGAKVGGAHVFEADDRVRLHETTEYPWRTVVLMETEWQGGIVTYCTGSLVGDFTVLTAAHCMYNGERGGFATSVTVAPAADGYGAFPFGLGYGAAISVPTGWSTDPTPEFDFGLLHLGDTDFGSAARPYPPVAAATDAMLNESSYLVGTAGYPSDKPFGTMWATATSASNIFVEDNVLVTWLDMVQGQSGSPVHLQGDDFFYTVGIVSMELTLAGSPSHNEVARLGDTRVAALEAYCDGEPLCSVETRYFEDEPLPPTSTPTSVPPTNTPTTGPPTLTPTATVPASPPTATPTAVPSVGDGVSGRVLEAGPNLVSGPIGGSLPPDTFVTCLPEGSWSALYIWDSIQQAWHHYFNTADGTPAYVNDPSVRGAVVVPQLAGVVVYMTRDVPGAVVPDQASFSCD